MNDKNLQDKLRADYFNKLKDLMAADGEEVMLIKGNTFAFPVLDDEQNERWVSVTVQIPRGSKDAPFDGHLEAEEFALEQRLKSEKAAEKAKIKAKKIESDKKARENISK